MRLFETTKMRRNISPHLVVSPRGYGQCYCQKPPLEEGPNRKGRGPKRRQQETLGQHQTPELTQKKDVKTLCGMKGDTMTNAERRRRNSG